MSANKITMSTIQYNRIKAVLAERQKTSRWLAEQLGKSTVTVSRWCTNSIQPTIAQLYQIAELLNIDVKDLLISNR